MNPQTPLFQIPITVTHKNNNPAIMLRTETTNEKIIKILVSAAFHKQPLIVQPVFKDEIKSMASLVQKGILYYDKERKNYFFTI